MATMEDAKSAEAATTKIFIGLRLLHGFGRKRTALQTAKP